MRILHNGVLIGKEEVNFKVYLSKYWIFYSFWTLGKSRNKPSLESFYFYKKFERKVIIESSSGIPIWSDSKLYVLLLFFSQLLKRTDIEVSALTLLSWLNKGTSNKSYESLFNSLEVLKGTTILVKENFSYKGKEYSFPLIDEIEFSEKGAQLLIKLNKLAFEIFTKIGRSGKKRNQKELFKVPISLIVDKRIRNLSYNLLFITLYLWNKSIRYWNLGDLSDLQERWFKEPINITRFKEAIKLLNSSEKFPLYLSLLKKSKSYVLRLEKKKI
jgi:hypothetical protein